MSTSPVAAYRGQNGVSQTGSFDPVVVGWIKQAATLTGADPTALLATALQESGAQRGRVGDNGTSAGPFQFHEGGALGSHSFAWANSYPAVLNRAQEFARLRVKGGIGAAAVQRPADRTLYARGVDSLLARASQILGLQGVPPVGAQARVPTGPKSPGSFITAESGPQLALDILNTKAPGAARLTYEAGIKPLDLSLSPTPGGAALPGATGPAGKVHDGGIGKVIGSPYHGTHAKAFNVSGGSDNWESENAIDIAMPKGSPIYAPSDGVIGSQIGSLGSGGRFAGLRVHLQTPGNELYFAHLSRLTVKAGERVRAGQIIGYSGVANGVAHLHLGSKTGSPMVYA